MKYGIIAGNGTNSGKAFTGIAPGVNLVDLQVLDANGSSSDATVLSAIATAIALKDVYHIKVINLSLGRPIQESYLLDPLCLAGVTINKATGGPLYGDDVYSTHFLQPVNQTTRLGYVDVEWDLNFATLTSSSSFDVPVIA